MRAAQRRVRRIVEQSFLSRQHGCLEYHTDGPPEREAEEVGIAAITASELLHGVHRATEEHRGRRETFVESILAAFP